MFKNFFEKVKGLFSHTSHAVQVTVAIVQVPLTVALQTVQTLGVNGYLTKDDYDRTLNLLQKIQGALNEVNGALATSVDPTSAINALAEMVNNLVNSGDIFVKNKHSQQIIMGAVMGIQTALATLVAIEQVSAPAKPSVATTGLANSMPPAK